MDSGCVRGKVPHRGPHRRIGVTRAYTHNAHNAHATRDGGAKQSTGRIGEGPSEGRGDRGRTGVGYNLRSE